MSLPSESLAVFPGASRSNAALVNGFRRRDDSAFTELFERHRNMVYRICLRYVGHHHDAEDITQETFRRAALAMSSVDSQRPIEPWLVAIAANRCRSFLSRHQRERHASSLEDISPQCGAMDDSQRRVVLSEQIDQALDRLPADQRRAFELVHQRELSYPEAADLMGQPLGTVKTWVRRAKQDMQGTILAADSVAANKPIPRTRKRTAALLASMVVLSCFGIAGRSQPNLMPTTQRTASPAIEDESQSVNTDSVATVVERARNLATLDWQWVSLNAFMQTRLSVENVDALPLEHWMQRTSPALDHLRTGIKPLESTLNRVAELFQCEVAQVAPLSTSTLNQLPLS